MATLSQLQTELAELKAARTKVLNGQAYRAPTGVQVTRVNLAELNKIIEQLETRVAIASNGSRLTHGVAVFRGTR